ncbi:MAG: ribulose-phosphate 3-epimerase [Eubacteriales bacterium]|nr:ribulose-phosphate 3-epimerase [Eubacteriales bacterium]
MTRARDFSCLTNKTIAPSILSADFWRLGECLDSLGDSTDVLHIDVMDGSYVPNISFAFPVLKAIRKNTSKILDTHLMIVEPSRYIPQFAEAGADILTVHYEAMTHHDRELKEIRKYGMKAGLTLNPGTSLSLIEELLPLIDLLLIMTVEPGFGGQSICENAYSKVARARKMIDAGPYPICLEVDGGINRETIASISEAGADLFVAGTAVFGADDPAAACRDLHRLAKDVCF